MIKSPPHWTILLVVLACLSLLGLEGWRDWLAHDQQFRETSTSLTNLATSLKQHAEDTFALADTVLMGTVERLQVDGTTPAALARLTAMLRARTSASPSIHDFVVFGEEGDWLASTMPVLGPNAADRAYFQHHLESGDPTMFIGPLIQSRATGRWTITASRRFNHPDGSFAGVALAMIDMDYFSRYFATYDLGPDHAIALLATSGALLAREPAYDGVINSDFSHAPLIRDVHDHPSGAYRRVSIVDGVDRVTGYSLSGRYPFVTLASMSATYVFADWWAQTRTHFIISGVLATFVAALGLHLARQLWRRSAAEARVRESETRYRLLAENSGDVIAMKSSAEGSMSYVSPAVRSVFGYEPDEFAALPFGSYLHPEDFDRVMALEKTLCKAVPRVNSVHRLRHQAGHWLWVDVTLTLADAGTADESLVVTTRDVTDRMTLQIERDVRERDLERANGEFERAARHLARARDAAEQANHAKSRFLAGISHELRTPLHGILGYAQLLRIDGKLDEMQVARVDAMLDAGTHLLTMINGVLDLSQIEADRLELQASEIDVRGVAAACLEIIRPAAEAAGLQVALSVQTNVPLHTVTDLTRLRQVLINLLGNAVKFTDKGTIVLRLTVTSVDAGPRLRFEIVDTGRGVPAEQRPHLFHAFERLGASAAGGVEGAGLGLALSLRLATLMGGGLGHDNNPGGGSVFWLELPLRSGQQPLADQAPALRSPGSSAALRVLVVDDVAMNRDIARSFLTASGHDVVCAAGGAEAVAAAAAADFDVVLMDVRMPDVDGLEATRRIRKLDSKRCRVPIVAVTAQAFAEQVEECRQAGMDDHLAKPFGPGEMLDTVIRASANGLAHAVAQTSLTLARAPDETIPVLNEECFRRTAAFLTQDAIALNLVTISARGEALLDAIHSPSTKPVDVAEAAHTLAGSAGMFGFERLSEVARHCEYAIRSNGGSAEMLIGELRAAIEATLHTIKSQTAPLMAA